MDAQIKEEAKEASLVCFDTSGDSTTNLASLSLVEKYSRYIQNENSEMDSDCDFFPDDTVLREEFALLTTSRGRQNRNHRLSTGLPGKYNSIEKKSSEPTNDDDDEEEEDKPQPTPTTDLNCLNELIERLAEIRRCEPDGNSIFCTEQELESIQERYGAILDFLYEKSSTFERRSSSKDSENEEQVDVGNVAPEEQRENMKLLAERIVSVQQARDRFYEVEQQVREQIEQLELVERYKMESVS